MQKVLSVQQNRISFFLFLLLHFCFPSFGQKECKKLPVVAVYDTFRKLAPGDRYFDSILRGKNEIELCFDGSFHGNFRVFFNDSVYFTGHISGNPSSGLFDKRFNLVKQNDRDNIMILENLDNGTISSFQVSSLCSHILIDFEPDQCKLVVHYTNRMIMGR